MFTNKMLNMELNMILTVLMEFACIRHSGILERFSMNTLQFKQIMDLTNRLVCNIIRFFVICL